MASKTSSHTSMALAKNNKIETRRLTLRTPEEADLEPYHSLRSDPRVMKYSATHLPDESLEVTCSKLMPSIPTSEVYEAKQGGRYMYVVCLRDGLSVGMGAYTTKTEIEPGAMVGDVGVIEFSQTEEGRLEGEVGYMLDPRLWGRGLVSEALEAYVAHWRDICKFGGVAIGLTAICEPENKASLRVLEKCGFRESKRWTHENGDKLITMALEV